ncbi:MAG: murein hydrolase activator EnvC family protein [Oscillospiraceae bacterium]
MGNRKLRQRFLHSACAALTALTVAAVPVLGGGAFADVKDYDQEIAALEQKAEKIKQDNEKREQQIGNLSDSVEENEAQMDLIQQQIEGINNEISTYGQLITTQQEKISVKEAEIADIEQNIAEMEDDIVQKQDEIASLELQNKENLKKFAKLIRALYMNDTSDTVPILEGSDDWYNFFTYVDVVQNISSQNLDFMNGLLDDIHNLEELIAGLEQDIVDLNTEKAELLDKKAELEGELSKLEDKKSEVQQRASERTSDLYDLSYNNESLKNQMSQIRSEINASNEDVEAINTAIAELIREKQAQNNGNEVVYSSDGFRWPLDSNLQYITTYFGYDAWRGGNHYGIDVGNAGIGGKNIYAAQGGTVITAYGDGGYHGGFGNYIIVDHGGGLSTVYAHCSAVNVVVGQQVNKGDVIGYVGSTGWSTGNHLHFETRVNGTAVNPFSYSYEYV